MDASKVLRSQAERLALRAEQRALKLQAELLEIEAKKLAIEAELDLAKGTVKRLRNFEVGRGGNRQCPFCWVETGSNPRLTAPSPVQARTPSCGATPATTNGISLADGTRP
jgi:hypothetical protein